MSRLLDYIVFKVKKKDHRLSKGQIYGEPCGSALGISTGESCGDYVS